MNDLKLKDIHELKDLLGYTDLRAVRIWCKNNELPITTFGKKQYICESMLKIVLLQGTLKSLLESGIPEHDANNMITALLADDIQALAGIIEAGRNVTCNFNPILAKRNESDLNNLINKYKRKQVD